MMKTILGALVACAALTSGSAFAQHNCRRCLQYWNAKVDQVWSCSNPNNPSGGQYAIIDNYTVAQEHPEECSDSRWCAAACEPGSYYYSN